ncbi:MAG: choice-of-anchor tandem repeat GloVer-containing protein [Candidatus Korobacteraceae bacterium]|jgi:uncharacterized repeat protein (TIGR03803 family)
MTISEQLRSSGIARLAGTAGLLILLLTAGATPAPSQTYTALHYFSGGANGQTPSAGITIDPAGNLYGTTFGLFGTVFELRYIHSYWMFSVLTAMPVGGQDGLRPQARVIRGPGGVLYGTTYEGGGSCSCGVVFELQPPPTAPPTALAPWTETVIHSFSGPDGAYPGYADLLFDRQGNIYGTTTEGGEFGQGAVFELTPSNGAWTESVIYSFSGFADGGTPYGGLIFDSAGNLYGTTTSGGQYQGGTVFELTPSGSGWTETVLHSFQSSEGTFPEGGLIFDASGNLYGTAESGGLGGYDGSVFELSPSNGGWAFSVLHLFDFSAGEGVDPLAGVTMDAAGNLYGTDLGGGYYDDGTVYRLNYDGGAWTYQTLHDFNSTTGDSPFGGVTFDSQGNMYGTAIAGGTGACNGGCGVVWEITP